MKLSAEIRSIFQQDAEGKKVIFEEFLQRISSKSFGVLLIIFSLPIAAPFTPPGFSIPFSVLIVIVGIQMIAKREFVWFPKWIMRRSVPGGGNAKFISWMVKTLQFTEKFIKPRMPIFTRNIGYRILGIVVTITGAAIALPVPVLNTVLSLGVFLIGAALLEEDGLVALGGVILSVLGVGVVLAAFWIVVTVGTSGLDPYINAIRDVIPF